MQISTDYKNKATDKEWNETDAKLEHFFKWMGNIMDKFDIP